MKWNKKKNDDSEWRVYERTMILAMREYISMRIHEYEVEWKKIKQINSHLLLYTK